jgi:serine-type D-Ala-D-Ala carboxypeptidase/endopeptidase (penicillin-binding protein 4)
MGYQHLAKGNLSVSRLRRMALLSLALLCVFTIGAGTAVARMLPARLAEFQVPQVVGRALAGPGPVLRAATGTVTGPVTSPAGSGQGREVTRAGLAAAISGLLGSPALGARAGALVTNLATGEVLYARGADAPLAPASTAKLATAVAALQVLGPGARFTTRVVAGATPSSVILVGGGDPTLAAGRPPVSDYPQPATLASLAAATARALRASGRRRVRLGFDTSLFTGSPLAPSWPASYVTTGNVTAITPLEVDQGRLTASGAPEDADDPGNFLPRSANPAAAAAAAFATLLSRRHIAVIGQPAQVRAPAGSATIAEVSSPPLAQIVQWMLTESNNVIAENLGRQLAIATGRSASFTGAAEAVTAVDRKLGVSYLKLADTSGLSPADRITPAALVALIRVAAAPGNGRLRSAITGLPVAGFSGTLAPGPGAFGGTGSAGLGMVRAKTGNLATVVALAGVAYARNGQLLAFAVMADQLPKNGLNAAAADVVGIATVLAGCGCR